MAFPEASTEERLQLGKEIFDTENLNIDSLTAYFKCYDDLTQPVFRTLQMNGKGRSHNEVLNLIRDIKAHPQTTFAEALSRNYPNRQPISPLAINAINGIEDSEDSINIAVHAMLMIDCSRGRASGYSTIKWEDTQTLGTFVKFAIPRYSNADDMTELVGAAGVREQLPVIDGSMRRALKGWKLRDRAHVKFRPTSNLIEHLSYDERDNSLKVFHHTAFLKAQLQRFEGKDNDYEMSDCISTGNLSPQLLLETLDSLQFIMFPAFDDKSSSLLEELVSKNGFDPNCLFYDGHILRLPRDFEYCYWNKRLVHLYSLVTKPRPKGQLMRWIERHSSERNALYIAILGLFLSAFFGALSVAVGIFQSWIAWQAWKYPLSPAA